MLLFELVNATAGEAIADDGVTEPKPKGAYKGFVDFLAQAPTDLRNRFDSLKAFLMALGDDVQMKQLKYYVAFRRLKNFACLEVHPQNGQILAYVKVDPASITLEPGFTKDATNIGHYGTGNLEIRIKSEEDLEKAIPLFTKGYENS